MSVGACEPQGRQGAPTPRGLHGSARQGGAAGGTPREEEVDEPLTSKSLARVWASKRVLVLAARLGLVERRNPDLVLVASLGLVVGRSFDLVLAAGVGLLSGRSF